MILCLYVCSINILSYHCPCHYNDHFVYDIMSTRRILLRFRFGLVIFVSNGESNIVVANGASSCNNISLTLILLGLD